jgi:hypothetical protein
MSENCCPTKEVQTRGGTDRPYTLRLGGDGTTNFIVSAGFSPASTGGTTEYVYSPTYISTATWYHAAVVFDKGLATMYLNGNSEYSSRLTFTSVYNSDNVFSLGGLINDEFDGILDDARVYNRALSANEVRALYNSNAGPTGYWKLDDNTGSTASDSSSNGYTTQSFTGNTTWTAGKYGSGLYFDGTDDVVRITEGANIDYGNNTLESYSVSAWINTTTNFGASASIFAKNDGSGAYPFDLYLSSSEFACFTIYNGTTAINACGSTALNDGNWHHLAGVRDTTAGTIAIYVDGIKITSTTDTYGSTVIGNNDDLTIGNSGTGTYTQFDFAGSIDEVRFYNYALTANNIRKELNESGELDLQVRRIQASEEAKKKLHGSGWTRGEQILIHKAIVSLLPEADPLRTPNRKEKDDRQAVLRRVVGTMWSKTMDKIRAASKKKDVRFRAERKDAR